MPAIPFYQKVKSEIQKNKDLADVFSGEVVLTTMIGPTRDKDSDEIYKLSVLVDVHFERIAMKSH